MKKFGVNKVPLVSVILTSYNQEKYLKESIESVLHQTFQDFELIIVDDCSSDDSWDIIQSYSNNIKVKTVRSQKNSGGFFCWEFMRGGGNAKYIAMHHSDDVWEPTKLEKQVAYLEAHPEHAACFTQVEFIDEDSKHYELPEGHVYKGVFDKENKSKEEWLNHFFYKGNCLCHPSVLIRKEMYEKYGLLDTFGLAQSPDFLIWIKLCVFEEIFIIKEALTKFRLRKNAQENTSADKPEAHIRSQIEMFFVLKEYLKIIDQEMFLKVFPQADIYLKNGSLNIKFALARLCLDISSRPYNLFAINLLFELINTKKEAIEIARIYSYTYIDFIRDTAKYDIFGQREELKYINSTLYFDLGGGFNEKDKITQQIYVQNTGEFFVKYNLDEFFSNNKLQGLRFDPHEGEMVEMSIYYIKNLEKNIKYVPLNSFKNSNDSNIFFNIDPQYMITTRDIDNSEITISGSIKFINDQQKHEFFERLNLELEVIYQSREYKFLQKCYKIKDFVLNLFKK